MEKRPRIFYGYWILAAAFLSLVISTGSVYWAFSLFIKPIQESLGWSRGQIILAFTIYSLIGGAAGPFVGRIIDRYGAKRVVLFDTIVTGLAPR